MEFGRFKPQKEAENKLIETQPERTQEFLDLVGDPEEAIIEMEKYRREQFDKDPLRDIILNLTKLFDEQDERKNQTKLPPPTNVADKFRENLEK